MPFEYNEVVFSTNIPLDVNANGKYSNWMSNLNFVLGTKDLSLFQGYMFLNIGPN